MIRRIWSNASRAALPPLGVLELFSRGKAVPFGELLSAHERFLRALVALPPEEEGAPGREERDGLIALLDFFFRLVPTPGHVFFPFPSRIIRSCWIFSWIRTASPPGRGGHPRLFVWGLLEARLMHADRVVLAGLNEGSLASRPAGSPFTRSFHAPRPRSIRSRVAHRSVGA